MEGVTKQQMRKWQERWQRVADFKREEERLRTPEERLPLLLSLMAFGRTLPSLGDRDDPELVARQWQLIRKNYARTRQPETVPCSPASDSTGN